MSTAKIVSYPDRECPQCSKSFEPRKSNQRFCNSKCKQDFGNKNAYVPKKQREALIGASENYVELCRLAKMTRPLLKSPTPFDNDLYRNVGMMLDLIEGK